MVVIDAAKARHLATISPVPDQNGRGSDARYAICGAPDSRAKLPQWPNCTLTPENWRPSAICDSHACMKANPRFVGHCAKTHNLWEDEL
jgi:hypothetical protein